MKKIVRVLANLVKLFIRLLSASAYMFPLLELYIYFNFFFYNRAYNSTSLLENVSWSLQFGASLNLAISLAFLYLVKREWVPYLLKYHLMVTLFLSMGIKFCDIIIYNFPISATTVGALSFIALKTFIFLVIALIMYCVVFALRGKRPKIPFITSAVNGYIAGPK
jgi:hypothetical protein